MASWICLGLRLWKTAMIESLMAVGWAMLTRSLLSRGYFPIGDAPHYMLVYSLEIGFYLWISSMAIIGIGGAYCWSTERHFPNPSAYSGKGAPLKS
jgi:hypothetical protein